MRRTLVTLSLAFWLGGAEAAAGPSSDPAALEDASAPTAIAPWAGDRLGARLFRRNLAPAHPQPGFDARAWLRRRLARSVSLDQVAPDQAIPESAEH